MDIWLHSNGFKWLILSSKSNSYSISWENKHSLVHALETDFGIHNWVNHWFVFDMNSNLVTEDEASLLVSLILVADVQVSVWDFILNLNIFTISSTLLDIFNMVKAGGGTSESSSFTILEVNLNFIISHTLKHLSSEFEEAKGLDISFVGIVEDFNCISLTWTTLKSVFSDLTS